MSLVEKLKELFMLIGLEPGMVPSFVENKEGLDNVGFDDTKLISTEDAARIEAVLALRCERMRCGGGKRACSTHVRVQLTM